jgi:hypothetical protein
MDPATIATVVGVIGNGLTAIGASETVLKYWTLVSKAIPHAIPAAEDAYAFIVKQAYPAMQMVMQQREPTQDEWNALDDHLISTLDRLNAQASDSAKVK